MESQVDGHMLVMGCRIGIDGGGFSLLFFSVVPQ
jgi:hypothetical protein